MQFLKLKQYFIIKLSTQIFRPRVVYNSKLLHIESVDWRLDFYKFEKLSCVDVLKLAINKKKTKYLSTPS